MRELRTVLYVDDEPDIRLLVKLCLELSPGLCVELAASGTEALESARTLKPDLILLDVMMPGLDGAATLQQLRADPAFGHTPIAFVTAKAMPAELERLRALGAADVIAKPFEPLKLATQVRALWQRVMAEGAS
jgi:two-component system, OmpR family, response regulator